MKDDGRGPARVTPALQVRLRVEAGGLRLDLEGATDRFPLVVLGPSGAGKSTLLESLAGLRRPAAGRLAWNGRVVFDREARVDLPARERRLGYATQDDTLFPHLSVLDNVLYPARRRKAPPGEALREARGLLDRLGLTAVAGALPGTISGGERQRAQVARALMGSPELLLLDEPFGALDPQTRERCRELLCLELDRRSLPAVLVTHDRIEALRLAATVWILLEGRLVQAGEPAVVFSAPADERVAGFLGAENVLPGVVELVDGSGCVVRCGGVRLRCGAEAAPGTAVHLILRPEDVALETGEGRGATSVRNHLAAVVIGITEEGPLHRVVLDAGVRLVALVTRAAGEQLGVAPGARLAASFKAVAIHLVPAGPAAGSPQGRGPGCR